MTSKAEAIRAAISQMHGGQQWLGRKEIAELPSILWEDELPERIIHGWYGKGNGIVVATNKRLVFVDKGLMWGLRVEDFPYDKVSSIEYNTGLLLGELTIYTSGNRAKIENIDKSQCREFAEYVRARITSVMQHRSVPSAPHAVTTMQTNPVGPQASPVASGHELMAQLERLGQLKIQGLIDDQEFKAAKAKLLGI